MTELFDRKRLGALKDTVAVVGVGETDYGADYRGAGGKAMAKGGARYDSYTLASRALKDRKSTRLNSSHSQQSRMPSSA